MHKISVNNRNRCRKAKYYPLFIMLVAVGVIVTSELKRIIPLDNNTVTLSKCVDGDTARFLIDGEEKSVRFLAIDTPETVKPGVPVQPYGKEASEFTCNALTKAKEIKLEYESGEKTDKYGRSLAWIWVDGTLLQKQLVANGLAEVKYLYGDYKYTDEIKKIEEQAKAEKAGLWSKR